MRAFLTIFVKFFFIACVGVLLGLCVTYFMIERGRGFSAVSVGPWVAYPKNGTADIDPYARAMLAHSREMPLGASEGLSFVARGDSAGAVFDSACEYRLTGRTPAARYWTLSLMSPSGHLIANKAQRNGFTSAEILRAADGGFAIAISRQARPGNWLPIGAARKFILVLRIYDTDLSAAAIALDESKLPRLEKEACP